MEATITKKATTTRRTTAKSSSITQKSKFTLWREKNPNGLGYKITNMKVILK